MTRPIVGPSLGWVVLLFVSALPASRVAAQLFRSPVTCTSCISDYYYLDEGGQDWNCGRSTYSGHDGTDYSLRYGNRAIDDDNEVVAMAAGVVVHAEDGYYDRCTQCGGANCGRGFGLGFANQVIINHGAYRTIYGHMKMGSIAVQEGDTVECGQVIGFIGSSGCSTGAHLHIEPSLAANFQVRPYMPIDPYEGDCSPTESSLFVDQAAYRTLPSPTCDGSPPVPTCPADTYDIWTCTEDGGARRRCIDGEVSDETCEWGCTAMPFGTDDVCAMPPDEDGDGSRADVDCDDADPAVHPGAAEVCGDGIDQECSGADMDCPTPPAAGMGGTVPPPAGAAGTMAMGTPLAGQPAPPLGQAGTWAAAGTGAIVPALPPARGGGGDESSGCSVSEPGARGQYGVFVLAAVALLALRGRRRRTP